MPSFSEAAFHLLIRDQDMSILESWRLHKIACSRPELVYTIDELYSMEFTNPFPGRNCNAAKNNYIKHPFLWF